MHHEKKEAKPNTIVEKSACAVLSVFRLRFYKNMHHYNAFKIFFFFYSIYSFHLIRWHCFHPTSMRMAPMLRNSFLVCKPHRTTKMHRSTYMQHKLYAYQRVARIRFGARARLDRAPLLFGPRFCLWLGQCWHRLWTVIHSDLTHTVWESIRFRINSVHWIIYAKLHNS